MCLPLKMVVGVSIYWVRLRSFGFLRLDRKQSEHVTGLLCSRRRVSSLSTLRNAFCSWLRLQGEMVCVGIMTLQFSKSTPFQAELQKAHKLRQTKYASAARARAEKARLIEIKGRPPLWKTSSIRFDAHVQAYQFHLANRLVRPEVTYIKRRCAELGIQYRDVVGPSIFKRVALSRRLLMWEVRQKFNLTYADIGRAFGGRDQSSAVSAIRSFDSGSPLH